MKQFLTKVGNKLIDLIKVKSIMTLSFTFVFCILSLKGYIQPDKFIVLFTSVVSFYFGVQIERRQSSNNTNE